MLSLKNLARKGLKWTRKNTFQWNFSRNIEDFIQEKNV